MNPISNASLPPIAPAGLPSAAGLAAPGAAKSGASFKDLLVESIREVNRMQQDADRAIEAIGTGQDVNPAEVLTAVQKADLAFRMLMQVRNKVVDAYEEVKNIRI